MSLSGKMMLADFFAELERHAFQISGGAAQDLAAHRRRSGKGDLIYIG